MTRFIFTKKALLQCACLACLALIALPAAAQDGHVELGEDSKGTWSLYLPSVEERIYSSPSSSAKYIAGWVQVVYKTEDSNEIDEFNIDDLNLEKLAEEDLNAALALGFLAALAQSLSDNEPHRGMFLYAANKETRQIQRISSVYYDEEGGEVSRSNGSFNRFLWKECPPGSIDEKIWQALMEASGNR